MITIEDIALEVGCSVNTVSRALNNKPDVSALTRRKVLEAADRLGYVPNTLAKSLVTKSSGSIGVIVPDIANPLYARIVSSIEREARQRQQSVLLGQSHSDPLTEKAVAEYLYQRRVDGILVIPCSDNQEHLESLNKPFLPIIRLLYEGVAESLFPYVGCLVKSAVAATVKHLAEQGRSNIAIVESSPNTAISILFQQGASMALQSLASKPQIKRLTANTELHDGYYATRQLLLSDNSIDGIILSNDLLAPGVIAALKELRIDCPRDVAVVGFGNMEFADYLSVPLTTVEVYPENIGREAIRLLGDLINKSDEAQCDTMLKRIIPAELTIRSSSGHVNGVDKKVRNVETHLFALSPIFEG